MQKNVSMFGWTDVFKKDAVCFKFLTNGIPVGELINHPLRLLRKVYSTSREWGVRDMLASEQVAVPELTLEEEVMGEVDFCRVPSGFTARRDRILLDMARRCHKEGIVLVLAPAGFGKTALLLQYAASIQEDPSRGSVHVMDATSMLGAEIAQEVEEYLDSVPQALHPVVVVDNVPLMTEADQAVLQDSISAARDEGAEFVLSCLPTNRSLVKFAGHEACIFAKTLIVQPKEYAQWARLYSISASLDVYKLTQGIPALVAMLQSATVQEHNEETLEQSIVGLYQAMLNDLRGARDPLFRIAAFMVMMGHGSIDDLERCGVRVRAESLARLARDWPLISYAPYTREFSCLGSPERTGRALRESIAQFSPHVAAHAARMLVCAGRIDDAVTVCEQVLSDEDAAAVVAMSPTGFALGGHGLFVSRLMGRLDTLHGSPLEVGAVLAVYLSALTMGVYRLARSAAAELRHRADEVQRDIDAREWGIAAAWGSLWETCSGVSLPRMPDEYEHASQTSIAARIMACKSGYEELIGGMGALVSVPSCVGCQEEERKIGLDLLAVAEWSICALDHAFHHQDADIRVTAADIEALEQTLSERRLLPILARVRMVDGLVRLMNGEPIGDERAFIDAGNVAVREYDQSTQLLCLAAEGWQALGIGQAVTARFRAQQVLRLVPEQAAFLRSWATLLEQCAMLQDTSLIGVREQADALDLSAPARDSTQAWCTALHLAVARFDSELSAWYSLHKKLLLEPSFAPLARLALSVLGARVHALERLIPPSRAAVYCVRSADAQEDLSVLIPLNEVGDIGQVTINLFGGFRVMRNGHTLTDDVWRRKRASALAARLALSMDSFIDRKTVTEEMWPDVEYARARKNLYVTLSSLRGALQQRKSGPQYVVTQADGMCFNAEYVACDVRRFDFLAREVLLRKTGKNAQDVIEDCLKIEQLYTGPLFVPDVGNPQFFVQMRRMYLSKFVDCMIRGIDVAIETENTVSATWLAEAALRQASTREDVIRRAMTVFDMCGRRREVVELYNSHLHYLEQELKGAPEDETRLAYERIINRSKRVAMI